MRVHNDTRLRPAWVVASLDPPQLSATWIVKGTYRLKPGASATEVDEPGFPDGDRFHDGQPEAGLKCESDFAPFKPRTDLLLVGTCHVPGGKPALACHASFGVGDWKKTVAVIGDRTWRRGNLGVTISDPSPFTSMPIRYALAYGGPGCARNPLGRGFRMEMLPNIEDPDRPIRSWDADTEPAGFGPIPRTWPQRTARLGSYGAEWLEERWPWFPRDFDWGHFNAAPRDQQVDGFLEGDESILLENLHPEHAQFATRLPGIRPQLFVVDGIGIREAPLRLDTIWIDADAGTLVLLWRGALPVRSIKLADVREIHLVQTGLVEARLTSDDVVGRVTRRAAAEARMKADAEAADAAEAAAFDAEMARRDEEAAAIVATALAQAHHAAVSMSDELRALNLFTFPPQPAAVEPAPVQSLKQVLQEAASDPVAGPIAAQLLAAHMPDIEEDTPDEPWTRERCLAHAGQGGGFVEQDLSGLDLSSVDLSDCNFSGAVLTGANLSKSRLTRCDFSRADLTEAVLKDADLRATNCARADLTGVQASGASFDGARLERASFGGAILTRASLRKVSADCADFSGAELSGARLSEGHFFKTNFSEATLVEADFSEAYLEHALVQAARASQATFAGADIRALHAGNAPDSSGASFRDCQGDASYWEGALLDGADFTGARLVRADFESASLRAASLAGADLRHAALNDAVADRADFQSANLFRASLQRASLRGADFRAASLYEADVWDANLAGARLDGANTRMTKLSVQP